MLIYYDEIVEEIFPEQLDLFPFRDPAPPRSYPLPPRTKQADPVFRQELPDHGYWGRSYKKRYQEDQPRLRNA
jgi:hypothetical protein